MAFKHEARWARGICEPEYRAATSVEVTYDRCSVRHLLATASEHACNSTQPLRTTAPESPPSENTPDLELRSNTATSFEYARGTRLVLEGVAKNRTDVVEASDKLGGAALGDYDSRVVPLVDVPT
jgi:hypothetical protein